ncbi:L,D-transpeptidase [Mycolicibacterium sediminis]|uniref:L,D-transpeptidase n=1 Tax=Mycolicibacterium sediminis TaxID=1286180 RepID=UPI0021F3C57E|nr:Ig-like domain-containing protein [Mycolicibacterium sediminis]
MTARRRHRLLVLTAVAVITALVTMSQGGSSAGAVQTTASVGKAAAVLPPPMPAAVEVTPRSGARQVPPADAVTVRATSGTLLDVRLTNEQGRTVAGQMGADRRTWRPAEPLGYGRDYTLAVTGRGTNAAVRSQTSTFSTVVPDEQTRVTLNTTAGIPISDGGTYGVGTVVVAQFDRTVPDRAAAQSRLQVTTTPRVEGAWTWINDRKAHWRPRHYFPSGTEVRVEAKVYGADLGDGVFGERDTSVGFRIGRSHVTIADDVTKQVSVFVDGELVRTMPVSMGRGGTTSAGNQPIHFWTQRGTYTVMDKANPVMMDSSTYGLPVDSAAGYRISVPYATRISPDGIYLHEREATVWAQGNTNVSAGCLNLSAANAKWFYDLSQPGDVVEVRNTGGKPLEQWQNGDWSVPWEAWLQGSAARA